MLNAASPAPWGDGPAFGMSLDWPDWGLCDDVRPALAALREAAHACVLATLYRVDGGGPRSVGTQMVFAEGVAAGFFSGGCVEADVACHALEVLATGAPRRLTYGEGSPFADIRLLCGARIDILLERILPDDPAVLALLDLKAARRPAVWTTDGRRRECRDAADPGMANDDGGFAVSDQPFRLTHRRPPTQRLVVVGGDPTALAIAGLGAQAGMETTLVRPKGPSAPPPLRAVEYRRTEAPEAFAEIGLDPWTAVAVATHDLEADEQALVAALSSPAGYVGVLGARRRIPERLARLRRLGVSEADLRRLRAPIGLTLGVKAPWAIAISVIGEIMQHETGAAREASDG